MQNKSYFFLGVVISVTSFSAFLCQYNYMEKEKLLKKMKEKLPINMPQVHDSEIPFCSGTLGV